MSSDAAGGVLASFDALPTSWRHALAAERHAPYLRELDAFVARERQTHEVYPPQPELFAALERTPFEKVRVLLLGQDPYHGTGQAHGLSFSVRRGVKVPPSLRNIYKELESDLGIPAPEHGELERWAAQGVLLLNSVLTVRAQLPHSHRKRGWERFSDHLIDLLAARPEPLVFLLWGKPAQAKRARIEAAGRDHKVLCAPHPSPLSAYRGFLGSRPFSQANAALVERGAEAVDWRLPLA